MNLDVIIKKGQVLDTSDDEIFDKQIDIGIKDGVIVALGDLENGKAVKVIDAKGKYVSPGFIDLHAHIYYGDALSVNPNTVAPLTGTTTIVDGGTSGAMNYKGFYEHIIKKSNVRIMALINISIAGERISWHANIFGGLTFGETEDMRLVDPESVIEIAKRPEVVGIKVRAGRKYSGANGMEVIYIAKNVAKAAGLPLVLHLTEGPPSIEPVLNILEAGDVYTHLYRGGFNGGLDRSKRIRNVLVEARNRGVLMDLGYCVVHQFDYEVAKTMVDQNFFPDFITSDLTANQANGSIDTENPPVNYYGLHIAMSTMLSLGMPLKNVIHSVTNKAAIFIKQPELGTLRIGTPADITIFEINNGLFEYHDRSSNKFINKFLISPMCCLKDGIVLN